MTIIDEPNTIVAPWQWEWEWKWVVQVELGASGTFKWQGSSLTSHRANTHGFDGQYILIKIDDVDTNFERAPNKR